MLGVSIPIGYPCLRALILRDSYSRHALYVLLLTFLCYTLYHASRKPISVVKGVLHAAEFSGDNADDKSIGWKPFDQENWSQLIGGLEYIYLLVYAVSMVISGYVAERINLRHFLAFGMLFSGLTNIAFGFAYYCGIHNYLYFFCVQVLSGVTQASGWPAVVTLMGNWWGKTRRGFIMGLWNAHTSVGNILGSLVAGYFADSDWGAAFAVPGIMMAVGGLVVYCTLIDRPERLQLPGRFTRPPHLSLPNLKSAVENVLAYSLLLFFAKLVSYTFLYWLPNYLVVVEPGTVTAEQAAQLSVLFDLGGIVGGILAGWLSDPKESDSDAMTIWRRAFMCSVMLSLAAPLLIAYQALASAVSTTSLVLLFCCGLTVNGPYALITTAVSADLGTQHALQGRARALATITAIIDGTGSLGWSLSGDWCLIDCPE
ncbi:transporter, major facilitator family protein [Opisthorchis viverrini]|uniref:Sugar phosphate exchanger 3 n=1 Tax=Opisthorchis viverrini TaxID=6198 RepID=A0A1S8WVW9_OPIVI|nr:transporter, major facilitator family protein [Opisthorchis viverrini]